MQVGACGAGADDVYRLPVELHYAARYLSVLAKFIQSLYLCIAWWWDYNALHSQQLSGNPFTSWWRVL